MSQKSAKKWKMILDHAKRYSKKTIVTNLILLVMLSSDECSNDQLKSYYSFSLSLIDFLQKHLIQLEKAMLDYSTHLREFERKSKKIFAKKLETNPLIEDLQHAFHSFIQTIEDEYQQFNQRRKRIHLIEIHVKRISQQIHSSVLREEKHLVEKYNHRLRRGDSSLSRRQYQQMSSIWKDHLDIIESQTVDLLWKLFSYSPINKVHSSIEIGSGDQRSPTSNNACMQSSSTSTEIDETMIEPTEHIDDDEQWLNLVKQNVRHIDEDRSLHLSDLSSTTSSINTGTDR